MNSIFSAAGDELTAIQLYALLKLRVDVFVVEQDCAFAELDGKDLRADTRHLWYQPDGENEPLACLRLLSEPDGLLRIGRVCTAKRVRGTGLGGALMHAALRIVDPRDAVLHSQLYAQEFYQRFGFHSVGEPFVEDKIDHIAMYRSGVST